jgi:hypothetical protein
MSMDVVMTVPGLWAVARCPVGGVGVRVLRRRGLEQKFRVLNVSHASSMMAAERVGRQVR